MLPRIIPFGWVAVTWLGGRQRAFYRNRKCQLQLRYLVSR